VRHTSKDIRDLASAAQLLLNGIIRSFYSAAQFIRALEVHRQLLLEIRHACRLPPWSAWTISRHLTVPQLLAFND
jgi:hypothetical protein